MPHPACRLSLLSLSLAAALPALAQTPASAPAATLPAVTVSAHPLGADARELAAPVSVIEGDDFTRQRGTSLGESLANEPGVTTSHFGTAASRPILRGMEGPRVRIMADGAEVMDASTISPDHAPAVDPMLSTGIEILRGPSALAYGGGAIGGVLNVLDARIPTAVPARGATGHVELRGGTAARDFASAFGVTTGAGQLALRAEGLVHHAGDYTAGSDWAGGTRVAGTQSRGQSGSLGAAWITDRGYFGLAFTSQHRTYGLPGHSHDLEGCHPHDDHLHCGSHGHGHDEDGHDEDHDHEHEHEHAEAPPTLAMRLERWDLRGERRDPFAGFSRLRLRGSFTQYRHDEIEGGDVATTFRNRAGDGRIELQHKPIAGWSGVIGSQITRRRFAAVGEEAYVAPTDTRREALFVHEAYRLGDWNFEAAARREWQRIETASDAGRRGHDGNSVSAGATWKFLPGWQAGASLTRAQRLPSAEELYADGLHLATRTWERGNAELKRETSHNLDLTLRKTAGPTTFKLGLYHNRVHNYIHALTLDELEGLQLIEYSQRDARFTGVEGEIRQALGQHYGVSLLGDYVRAELAGNGGHLARIPAARAGLRGDYQGDAFDARAEVFRVASQRRVAEHETPTPGYTLVNLGATYRLRQGALGYQLYARLDNLTNRVAYAHTSFIKDAAPLMGRNLVVGVRMDF
ncbi:MAG: TonB-dependent receptor [Candidatus Dactylopiibacterium sp.]|nr:TonB-dependent receptor [Candidatus Dactylopiibacterium sp.]